jgi:hypothetical protein
MVYTLWRGGRVVEGSGLENRRRREASVGSNPTLSVYDKGFGGFC